MSYEGAACVAYCNKNAMAHVQIVDPIDYQSGDGGWEQDMEASLVHELLHLRFGCVKFDEDDYRDDMFERAIDVTARALVDLSRGSGVSI